MGHKTPLYECYEAANARIVDFGGWDMPLHFGSQLEEHHAVRQNAGLFDVSHMTVIDVAGVEAQAFLQHLLANDVARLKVKGKALYSAMLNNHAGVIDDLIVYFFSPNLYRLVVNASTREKDLQWINSQAEAFQVTVNERSELAMLAVQGPNARRLAMDAVSSITAFDSDTLSAIKVFSSVCEGDYQVARTGYTGEDGWEIILPAADSCKLWQALIEAGVQPAGLGARDTLRLEAGMNLYGSDMDEHTTPLDAGLEWTIAWEPEDRNFVGRGALEKKRDADHSRFVGLLLEDKGVLRDHMRIVIEGKSDGEITSGGFSPTLQRSIALARLPAGDETTAAAEVRGRLLKVRIVDLPFVRNGKIKIDV